MASDYLITETNLLERIAKAAERIATALEKMVIEDDDEEPKEEKSDPVQSYVETLGLIRKIVPECVTCTLDVESAWIHVGLESEAHALAITKDQAAALSTELKVERVSFYVNDQHDKTFRRFQGWVNERD